ncbi:VOC family protein [Algibacter mikhailovii]|uniref:VOC family protein n=1 Tax=Algibacter mikhailovii TaxID=425498 RepID=UPI002494BA93|nr:VOC family protein [Algibacter mikhailovii]
MKNVIIILTICFGSIASMAQNFNTELEHISIIVKDVEKSAAFYKNILHLKELPTPWGENTPLPAVFFDLGNKRELHVTEYNSEVKLHKFIHLAFAINDFDAYLQFLNKNGISYGEFSDKNMKFQTRIDGVRQIYFQDPDGYWIEVNDAKH